MDWLREFYLFSQNTTRRPLPVTSKTVLYRRFKEYFSLKISKNFRNFIIKLQVKEKAQFVSEAATEGVLRKKVFLKISQTSQENICIWVSFSIKLRPTTSFKKRLWHRCFPVNFVKPLITPILKNICERLLLPFKKWPLNFDRFQIFIWNWKCYKLLLLKILLTKVTFLVTVLFNYFYETNINRLFLVVSCKKSNGVSVEKIQRFAMV